MLLISNNAKATHIVGGEIYYDYLGGNNYKITMKVYRDCLNGIPPFDNPAVFTVFDNTGAIVQTFNVTLSNVVTVQPSNNSPCAPATSGNACVEETQYENIINLPPRVGGYYIAYQRCCRNGTINNLVNPGGVGATYWEHIPGPEQVLINSSPRFTNRPPIYVCNKIPIAFNHVATDPDGDSLVYSLCTPFNGLDGCCPVINVNPYGPNSASAQCFSPPAGNCPMVNEAPPYISVPFLAPYSASYPMASNPAININPQTGFLNGNPSILGQWVVGICVSEYRNGALIGTHHRDFQFNVIDCPFVIYAVLNGQTTTNSGTFGNTGTGYCNGFTVNYQNVSFGPDLQGFYWDFGDPATLADTSNIQNPSYTFPGIGDYTVTLIANPGSPCADTAHEVFHIAPLLSPDFLYPSAQCLNGNSFDYTAGGTFQGTGTFQWNFGADAIPSTSTATYVPNVHYTTAGTHTVSFMVAENACTATTTKTIQVYANPEAQIGNFNPSGCVPQTINFNNLSTASSTMAYNWSFSDGTTSTLLNPVKTFSIPGVYSVSLTVHTSENCIDSSKVVSVNNLTVFAVPAANFNYTSATANCFTNNSFNFTSSSTFAGTTGVLNWSFGSTATPSVSSANLINNLIYNSVGFYTVTLVAAENGCKDSTKQYVSLYANPLAAISNPTIAGCNPQTLVFNNTSTSSSDLYYQWMFSNGQTSIEKNPTVVFSPSGIYSYTLMVYTIDKCIDKSYVYGVNSITVSPSPISIFTADPLVVSIFEPLITFQDTSTIDVVSWLYDFGTGDTSSLKNPIYTYATWGNYTVTETVTNQFNCSATSKVLIRILPEHRFFIPDAFTPGNYDELNDVFKPIVMGVKEYKFYIFDRWGEQIFKSTDIDEGWNGKYQGVICKQDVYVWKCDFRNIVTNKEEHHVGHVTLVR